MESAAIRSYLLLFNAIKAAVDYIDACCRGATPGQPAANARAGTRSVKAMQAAANACR